MWQIDHIRSLSEASYALMAVDTAPGLMFAWPCAAADQKHIIQAFKHLCAFYGRVLVVEGDQGFHFTRHDVQTWENQMDIQWKLHFPHNPQAAGMIERYNRLLKQHLRVIVNPLGLQGWVSCLCGVLRDLDK